ncbi:MAG: DUF1343 domain-containing protein [Flammeovirgaceae bacterium]|nr:DUF1343 domain-containing protein [Flammeovirgaceae bacterium]
MIRSFVFLLFLHVGSAFSQSTPTQIATGAQQLNLLIPQLKGKQVGLVVNHTATINNTHLVDSLLKLKINVKKIFSPEHGFRGTADAGEKVADAIDPKTKLPVVSLYGENRKPKPEQTRDLDVIVFDIQDVGVRFYTYISTLHYVMEACAENGKKLIVLDRPNPNGHYIDGPVLDPSLKSFVGMHPVPIVHGMTIGEYAQMINGEGWLGDKKCDLTVIAIKNYTHRTSYSIPIKPSPNLPTDNAIAWYPSICLFEGTVISVGRGTQNPFEIFGHPLTQNLQYSFTPKSIKGMSTNPPYENEACYGVDLRAAKAEKFTIKYLLLMFHLFPDKEKFFNTYFDKLAGTKSLQEQIKNGLNEEKIKDSWKPGLDAFKETRKKYLIYPD